MSTEDFAYAYKCNEDRTKSLKIAEIEMRTSFGKEQWKCPQFRELGPCCARGYPVHKAIIHTLCFGGAGSFPLGAPDGAGGGAFVGAEKTLGGAPTFGGAGTGF
jgi:hypothetical protein